MSKYKAIIKNISQDKWLVDETDGAITLNDDREYATLFLEKTDAENTIEFLNDTQKDCYTLIVLKN